MNMVKTIKNQDVESYQCKECRYVYKDKKWAEKCEAWCKEHKSCNLEIIQHGRPAQA